MIEKNVQKIVKLAHHNSLKKWLTAGSSNSMRLQNINITAAAIALSPNDIEFSLIFYSSVKISKFIFFFSFQILNGRSKVVTLLTSTYFFVWIFYWNFKKIKQNKKVHFLVRWIFVIWRTKKNKKK